MKRSKIMRFNEEELFLLYKAADYYEEYLNIKELTNDFETEYQNIMNQNKLRKIGDKLLKALKDVK